jgi:small subunit ribosomal protein S1
MTDEITDESNDQQTNGEESFADLLESYSEGMGEDLRVGDRIEAKIIAIGKDTVFVDTGTKIDGAVDKAELIDENGAFPHAVGDILELYVVAADESEIRLSKAVSGVGGLNMLREAFQTQIPVEGKVIGSCKGGFNVEVIQRRAFCPISQMDVRYVETPEAYTDKTFSFFITQFAEGGRNIVVSRRKFLEKEMKKARQAMMETLSVGTVLQGRVTRLMPYGAFVELTPGLEGMVHISELSWSRIEKPEEAVAADETITVKIIGIASGDKPDTWKISLSVKQVSADPWETVADRFRFGDKVKGKVTRCANFGAFVEIAPGIEGLVHISEMSYAKRVTRSEDIVTPGDTVMVMVKEFDPARKRISLSLREADGDPWADIEEKYAVGQPVTGTVEKKEAFGLFVNIAPGITGLFPKSKIAKASNAASFERLKPGDPVSVIVEEIHADVRRMTFGAQDGAASADGDWKQFSSSNAPSLGSLGDKLRAAMASKEK